MKKKNERQLFSACSLKFLLIQSFPRPCELFFLSFCLVARSDSSKSPSSSSSFPSSAGFHLLLLLTRIHRKRAEASLSFSPASPHRLSYLPFRVSLPEKPSALALSTLFFHIERNTLMLGSLLSHADREALLLKEKKKGKNKQGREKAWGRGDGAITIASSLSCSLSFLAFLLPLEISVIPLVQQDCSLLLS